MFRNLTVIAFAAGLLAACGGLELNNAQMAKPSGDAFSKALYGEYVTLSKNEYGEGDYEDSDVFALRAIAAAVGKPTEPEAVAARKQGAGAAKALTAGRGRLVKALGNGSKTRLPADAARAQAMYECWAQEQEENTQQDHIDQCRIDFFIALARIESAPAAAPKPAPAKPVAKLSPLTFIVYFGFNSTALDDKAMSVIGTAANVIKSSKPQVVSVVGHTDRAGASNYNSTLAEKRSDAVSAALTKAGVSGRLLTLGSLGENAPSVATADGVKNSENRRVEITVRY
jgi:OOP family OmpA-OmpF porin